MSFIVRLIQQPARVCLITQDASLRSGGIGEVLGTIADAVGLFLRAAVAEANTLPVLLGPLEEDHAMARAAFAPQLHEVAGLGLPERDRPADPQVLNRQNDQRLVPARRAVPVLEEPLQVLDRLAFQKPPLRP